MTPGDELLFLALGGAGEIGMNVNLLGVILTHGHEDHIGAVPYLAADLGVPLYATPFAAGLVRRKLAEEGIAGEVELNTVPLGSDVRLGPFHCRYVALAHSIPEGNAVIIDTPHGRIFHTGDWKLDDRPIIGDPATAAELSAIGDNNGKGTLALVGDSTNVFNQEASGSETDVKAGLLNLIGARTRGRVVVTTFASNVARLHTLGEVARATGRRLVVAGRSLDRMIQVAQETGYLADFPDPLPLELAASARPETLLIASTGTQGEPQAALARMADGSHPFIRLERGDLVVYSSRAIPGNEVAIGRVQNDLAANGVEIVTERQVHVHVSGHPGRPELETMYGWIRPRIALPVHGERRHMEEHARLALLCQVPHAIVAPNGTAVRLAPGDPAIIGHQPTGRLVLDGDVILAADGTTMGARRKLAHSGLMVVTLAVTHQGRLAGSPAVVAQGIPVEEDAEAFLEECREAATNAASKAGFSDERRLMDEVKVAVRRVARKWTGKKPPTDVALIRI
jgi:ribonuclease J